MASEAITAGPRVRQNYVAILVAAVASFLLEAGWYSAFYTAWADGIGRTNEWLMANSPNRAPQFGTALVAAAVLAASISCLTQLTGAQTALRGMKTGAMLWAGVVLTTWATEYIFEVRPVGLWLVNLGFWLIGMVMMGAIVGAWKKKSA